MTCRVTLGLSTGCSNCEVSRSPCEVLEDLRSTFPGVVGILATTPVGPTGTASRSPVAGREWAFQGLDFRRSPWEEVVDSGVTICSHEWAFP